MQHRLESWVVAAILAVAVPFGVSPALAGVDDGAVFELDGNAEDNPAGVPDDWQNVANDNDSALETTNGDNPDGDSGIVRDVFDPANTDLVFTGGGSKDDELIARWKWKKAKASPPKNDIANAAAAAYQVGTELRIHFFADRIKVQGDAQVGFWFLQANVGPDDPSASGGGFTGEHVDGDILVLSNFVGGGGDAIVEVWEWILDGGTDGNTNLKKLGDFGDCDEPTGNQDACALTNDETIPSSGYFYQNSDSKIPANTYPPRAFFEGALDLGALLGVADDELPCFTSFQAETRSSQSTTATLHDFAGGAFDLCAIAATKVCEVTRLATIDDEADNPENKLFVTEATITVKNTGAASLPIGTTITVVDTPDGASTPPDDVTITLTEVLIKNDTVDVDLTFFTDNNPPMNQAHVTAEFNGQTLEDDTGPDFDTDAAVECEPLQLNPALFMFKDCETSLAVEEGLVAVQVDFGLTTCNTGDLPLSVAVVDETAGLSFSVDLDAGTLCEQDSDCNTEGEEDGVCIGFIPEDDDPPAPAVPGVCANLPGVVTGGAVCDIRMDSYLPSESNDVLGDPTTDPLEAFFTNTANGTGSSDLLEDDVMAMSTANCPLCPPTTD